MPIAAENSTLHYAWIMRLRYELFPAGYFLVHGTGDGAGPNLKVLPLLLFSL
jgi:hypothetical protein